MISRLKMIVSAGFDKNLKLFLTSVLTVSHNAVCEFKKVHLKQKYHVEVQGTKTHKSTRNMIAFVLHRTIIKKTVIQFFYI